jgi:hypothetical protein
MLDPATKIVATDEDGKQFEAYPFGRHLILVPTTKQILILMRRDNAVVAEFPPHRLDMATLAADCLAPEIDALGDDPADEAIDEVLRAGMPWFRAVNKACLADDPLPPPLRRWAIEHGVELPSLRRPA